MLSYIPYFFLNSAINLLVLKKKTNILRPNFWSAMLHQMPPELSLNQD